MVERSGRPLSISVARNPMLPDAFRGILDRITDANADGLRMTGQVAPRAVGLLLGLECTLNPFMTIPAYREIADLPLAERVALLRDPEFRSRVLQSADERSPRQARRLADRALRPAVRVLDEPDYEPSSPTRSAPGPPAAGVSPDDSHST